MARTCPPRTLLAQATLAAVAIIAACATAPSQPQVIPFPGTAYGSPQPRGLISSYDDALTLVLWVMENDLALPHATGSLRLYKDRAGLEAGLIGEGYDASYAHDLAEQLDGLSRPGLVLAKNSTLVWQRWPKRIAFLAHETTHVVEYSLADGRRGSSDQWLREGLAEWVSWQVVQSLQLGSFADRKRIALVHLRDAGHRNDLPDFDQVTAQSAWVREGNRTSGHWMYDEAFLAADLLISRHGLPAVLEYFRLFASSNDQLANFRAAFHEEPSAFAAAFEERLSRLLG